MPAVVGDIFGLGDVYIRQVSPVTVGIDTSGNFITESGWSNLRSYGWFGGGGSPGVSTVNRIDFSNDTGTASVRGSLSSARYRLAATGNSNYGWFGGGQFFVSPTNVLRSTVDRIDFSNDSTTASVRGSLSSARERLSATGNSNYGWFGGGSPVGSTVDRIDFSNDSIAASARGNLSLTRQNLAATGNSNYGWFVGGFAPSISGPASTVERIDFSNDSATASPRGPLFETRQNLAATSGQAKGPSIKLQKAGNFGWFGGGGTPGNVSTIDRIDFSNDSPTALVRGPLSLARSFLTATGNSNYGWFGGGSSGPLSTVDRIDFSNDSAAASPRSPLFSARYVSATGNSNYGWFGGGPFFVTAVDRINFFNDLRTASLRGSLIVGRGDMAATGNSNYGWFGGGFNPGPIHYSTVERIDFSNDLTTVSARGPLSLARRDLAATGNSNYGWFGGGRTNPGPQIYTNVERIDFSNDLTTVSARGSLSQSIFKLTATGNSNYGWFGGGNNSGPSLSIVSKVDRINFSNDSITTSPRGSLTVARQDLAATSNTPI